jgi:hypothetical protein
MKKKIITGIVLMLVVSFVVGGFRIVEKSGVIIDKGIDYTIGSYDALNKVAYGHGCVEWKDHYIKLDDGSKVWKVYVDSYTWRESDRNNTFSYTEIVWR